MANGIYIVNGTTLTPSQSKILITPVPLATQPQSATATASSGGSLTSGKTYYYKITAVGYNGESAPSAEVSATPSGGNLSVTLGWTAQTTWGTVKEYRVYRGTTSGVYTSGYMTTNTNSLIDTGALAFNSYNVTIPTSNPITAPQTSSLKFTDISKVAAPFINAYYDESGTLREPTSTRLVLTDKCEKDIFDCDLKQVVNQSGWNTGTQAACSQAVADIDSWLA